MGSFLKLEVMKTAIRKYFNYWLDFYSVEKENRVEVLNKIDELFECFDKVTQPKISKQWKETKNRSNYSD